MGLIDTAADAAAKAAPQIAETAAGLARPIVTALSRLIPNLQGDAQLQADVEREIAAGMQRVLELEAADRASARAREIAVRDSTPRVLAYLVVGGFLGVLAALMFVEIPARAEQPLNLMLGFLGAGAGLVLGYYFGSSSGSAKKNEMLNRLTAGRRVD
jgi:uncharacterized membrane protein YeaQ/YmgE (transglycosylase-associated protein family)